MGYIIYANNKFWNEVNKEILKAIKNMKPNIEIIPPEGYEVDTTNKDPNKIIFKKSEITYDKIEEELYTKDTIRMVGFARKNVYFNFHSIQQAEKVEAINKLLNVAKYLNGNESLDKDKTYYAIYYSNESNKLGIYETRSSYIYHIAYFKTQELANRAITILGEEVIKKALQVNY